MILGEICNFAGKPYLVQATSSYTESRAAYAFVEAIVVVRLFMQPSFTPSHLFRRHWELYL